ncbi:hypothetical protein LOC67_23120 [Stieleria sp. JC731]|uniref:hypothetical protein n=1 Tax=Stieleria sp. JC731 TaxID=2894195 RepID=UPI001E328E0C|nr:hypothetical protein [Stieleria sp. JC731]MCC9603451.1 hypothetical protein [Stieleria sp. JC731]
MSARIAWTKGKYRESSFTTRFCPGFDARNERRKQYPLRRLLSRCDDIQNLPTIPHLIVSAFVCELLRVRLIKLNPITRKEPNFRG